MRRKPGLGYDHLEVIVDDRSRRGVVVEVPDDSGASAATALAQALAVFAADGITVERVLTDNGLAYRSHAYRAVLGERRHSRTRPYRPQTNGKAERFIGTLLREWAYARPYGPTPSDSRRCRSSSITTISAARTPRSVASHPRPLSTTSVVTTARARRWSRDW